MDKAVLEECLTLALEGKIAFPESVKRMVETGVERYRVDLTKFESTYYSADGDSARGKIPLKKMPEIAGEFDAEAVRAAIRESQAGKIDYPEFLKRVMAAGCVAYDAFLAGQRVTYHGRKGDFHVEYFPGTRVKDPMHGVTLEKVLTHLVSAYGWKKLGEQVKINCFTSDPSIKSSLNFLRKTPWARTKVENLYRALPRKPE